MKPIKTIIIDDDAYMRDELSALISKDYSEEMELVEMFSDPKVALEYLRTATVDLILLDIFMPGMSGFDLLDKLGRIDFRVIFITSFNEYAIRAIRYSALDYLLKPIKNEEFKEAIARYRAQMEPVELDTRLSNLRHNLESKNPADMQLVLGSKQGERRFAMKEIVRCEADSNYTNLHLHNGNRFMASKTLGEIEQMLSELNFLRVHKTHLVNPIFVSHISGNDALILRDGSHVPVSRRRAPELRDFLQNR